jgi:hypothetical protein
METKKDRETFEKIWINVLDYEIKVALEHGIIPEYIKEYAREACQAQKGLCNLKLAEDHEIDSYLYYKYCESIMKAKLPEGL